MLHIKIIENPDRKITQTVLYFQFRFMEWSKESMVDQDDKYGSIPFAYVLAYDNDTLLGVLNLLVRKIKYRNTEISLGGIGGVCVHEDYRRQGIAKKMLVAGVEFLKKSNVDVAYLCTDIPVLGDLYKSGGFKPLDRPYIATGISGRKYKDDGGMIAPIGSIEKFSLILNDKEDFDLQGQDW